MRKKGQREGEGYHRSVDCPGATAVNFNRCGVRPPASLRRTENHGRDCGQQATAGLKRRAGMGGDHCRDRGQQAAAELTGREWAEITAENSEKSNWLAYFAKIQQHNCTQL